MNPISRKQPLYDQLVDLLHEKIENEMGPGDLLPSERELCETYGLSRTTVRLALAELEQQGLVTRQHGRGTFVANTTREATNLMSTYSFTEQMRSLGRVPQTVVLEFDTREAPKHIAACLGLRIGDPVIRMKRLRLADGTPMMVERTYLPASEFIGLSREDVERQPLYDIVEKVYHETIRVADEEFCASVVHMDDAELLGIPESAPVLKLYRTTYNVKNTVIEYTRSVARADQFKYKVSHYRG
ncbi:GntR family transcriptional regulator [Olsenella sp. Marseille-P4559]|jgi:GntR family transcriptional regulator|uniref:GntR family transcriptional regulator n=1 Tax=Olsenella sp. Marseille-P4559 TaxID=2364795 RepID=UPI0010308CC9|nr:GntR family transcriptional regulator [Olsenella sp. Marseille-P4559]